MRWGEMTLHEAVLEGGFSVRAIRRTSPTLIVAWAFMAADIAALILIFAGRS